MKEKFYKISQPTGLIEFIKTDEFKTETTLVTYNCDDSPSRISHNDNRWYKAKNKSKLTHFSIYCGVLSSTKCFTEISEAEFKEQVEKFMNQIYPSKTTEQNVQSLAT